MTEAATEPVPTAAPTTRISGVVIATLVVSIVAVLSGAAGLTLGVIEHSKAANQTSQIRILEHRQNALDPSIAAITSRVAGSARDVITCGDLHAMYLQSYYLDSNYNLQSNPISLPQHSIANRAATRAC